MSEHRFGTPLARIASAEAFARIFHVSRETLERFIVYERLLRRWQKAVNLVAPATLEDLWHRHFADSAQLLPIAPPQARSWLDLGSGAGFPGLVLALLLRDRDGAHVTLIESDSRKAAFLREAARQTSAPATILCARVEKIATQAMIRDTDVVTARALAPLPRLLDWVQPFFGLDTVGIFPKGEGAAREVAEARAQFAFTCELVPSITRAGAQIVVIRRLEPLTKRA